MAGQEEIIKIRVEAQVGRIDKFLAQHFSTYSRSQIQKWFEQQAVRVGGKAVSASHKLSPGTEIEVCLNDVPKVEPLAPVAMPLEILFEDDYLLVVNKPAGLAVHPGAGIQEPTLVHGLLHHTGGKLSHPPQSQAEAEEDGDSTPKRQDRPGIVHRLDKDTTGALVVAKDDATHAALAEQFAQKTNYRQYIALLQGVLPEGETDVRSFLARDSKNPTRFQSHKQPSGTASREAWSLFKREKVFFDCLSFASIRLYTGRTHQIRIHAAQDLIAPVVGDPLYGQKLPAEMSRHIGPKLFKELSSMKRQLLHAWVLGFDHPKTGKHLDFKAPLPADFAHILTLLGVPKG